MYTYDNDILTLCSELWFNVLWLQASQIVQLILDYQRVVSGKLASTTSVTDKPSKTPKKKRLQKADIQETKL